MGIVKDAELRKGKAELVRALAAKGVAAQPYERLDALAAKVAGAGGGGEPGGTPERFGNAVLVPPMPGLSVSTLLTPPPTTWNPNDKNANVVLSNGNLTAYSNETYGKTVRASFGKASGKWYFECLVINVNNSRPSIGICSANTSLDYELGNGTVRECCYTFKDRVAKQVETTFSDFVSAIVAGNIVGVAVDMDAGSVQFYCNGAVRGPVLTGILSQIPVAYPVTSVDSVGGVTARFAAASFTYSPPAGYSAWDS